MTVVREAGVTGTPVYVARLLVDPNTRRRGIGRALLDHATRAALEADLVPVLDVVASARKAIALYEATGWAQVGTAELRLPDGSVLTELVYRASTD